MGAKELIDIIIEVEDVKTEKTNLERLLQAIDNLKVTADEVLYEGDSMVKARTAENAKAQFISVSIF